jgi:hypothetical protein
MEQKLGSARLHGGTTVAYATAGGGPFLLFIGGWLSHLELSWALPRGTSPVRGPRARTDRHQV